MSIAQTAVLVLATLLAIVGGVAALTAEIVGARARGVRHRWADAAGLVVPYVALGLLVWWIWQGA